MITSSNELFSNEMINNIKSNNHVFFVRPYSTTILLFSDICLFYQYFHYNDFAVFLLQLMELESAVKKREELIVQLSSALQTVTNQVPSDVIATEMAEEIQNLKTQLLNVRFVPMVTGFYLQHELISSFNILTVKQVFIELI